MSVLHVFDMDGTLLGGTSASLQLARVVGNVDDLIAMETAYAAGTLLPKDFAATMFRLWKDLTPALVADAFANSPWLHGIREVCADIRARGERSIVITLSPDFFANGLLELGFDEVHASAFPPMPFTAPFDTSGILGPEDKVRIVTATLKDNNFMHCVAFGDSMSDAPLFRLQANTVAVNADEHLAGIAAVDYHGDNIWDAYQLGRGLLGDG